MEAVLLRPSRGGEAVVGGAFVSIGESQLSLKCPSDCAKL